LNSKQIKHPVLQTNKNINRKAKEGIFRGKEGIFRGKVLIFMNIQ